MRGRPPAPGSDAAISRGCACDREANRCGQGYLITSEGRFWAYDRSCPLHAAAYRRLLERAVDLGQVKRPLYRTLGG